MIPLWVLSEGKTQISVKWALTTVNNISQQKNVQSDLLSAWPGSGKTVPHMYPEGALICL